MRFPTKPDERLFLLAEQLNPDTPVVFFDYDGVFNPLNVVDQWVGEGEPSTLDYVFRDPKKWEVVELPVDGSTHYNPDCTGEADHEDRTYVVKWSSELVEELNWLVSSSKVQVVWLTTWRQDVNTLVPLMGLETGVTWLPWRKSGAGVQTVGKAQALAEFLDVFKTVHGQEARYVWVDDQETGAFLPPSSLKLPYRGVILQPQSEYGLSRAQGETMRRDLQAR